MRSAVTRLVKQYKTALEGSASDLNRRMKLFCFISKCFLKLSWFFLPQTCANVTNVEKILVEAYLTLRLELDIYSLAHHLYKMLIFYEPRRVT